MNSKKWSSLLTQDTCKLNPEKVEEVCVRGHLGYEVQVGTVEKESMEG